MIKIECINLTLISITGKLSHCFCHFTRLQRRKCKEGKAQPFCIEIEKKSKLRI